jgi:nucleoside 2-deoxyribosyltransferase
MKSNTTIYFAAPLFTQAEWQWNELLAKILERNNFNVILPQSRANKMLNGKIKFDPLKLFLGNIEDIKRANVVLAILDQPDPDSGTCWECGYAYNLGRPIVGLRTDIRRSSDGPDTSVNLMLSLSCKKFIEVPLRKRNAVKWVANEVAKAIRNL